METSQSFMSLFSSRCGWQSTLWNPIMLHSPLDPLYLTASSNALDGKELSSSNVKADISHRGKNLQTELIIVAIRDDILLGQ
jgi:hypothetical protein